MCVAYGNLIKVLESKIIVLEAYISLQKSAQQLSNSLEKDTEATDLKYSFSKEIEKFSDTLRNISNKILEINASKKLVGENDDAY